MCSMLENVPCALELKVYSAVWGWNVLKIPARFVWSNVSFKAYVSLLIFCPDDLSIGISEVLKSPIVIRLISPFMVVSICLLY